MKGLTRQIHADVKKRRSSFLVALLFADGDLRRGGHHRPAMAQRWHRRVWRLLQNQLPPSAQAPAAGCEFFKHGEGGPSFLAADRPDALLEGQGGGELGDGPGADQHGLCCAGEEKRLDPWGSGLPDQHGHQQRGVQVARHQ